MTARLAIVPVRNYGRPVYLTVMIITEYIAIGNLKSCAFIIISYVGWCHMLLQYACHDIAVATSDPDRFVGRGGVYDVTSTYIYVRVPAASDVNYNARVRSKFQFNNILNSFYSLVTS